MLESIKRNVFAQFIGKLFILLSLIYFLDFSIGHLLRYFYFKQVREFQYLTTYSMEKTKANLLIFGSSRAKHHYHPDILDKKILDCSYYNTGRDANCIIYHYAVLKSILKRYSPKIVILEFGLGELVKNQDSYDRLASLLPYYKDHPEIRSLVQLKSPFEKLKLISNIYPFNSCIIQIASGNVKKKSIDMKGYVALTRTWNGPLPLPGPTEPNSYKFDIDSIKVRIYRSFITDCINSHVKLYVVCSPYLSKSGETNYSILLGKEIAEKYGIAFWDYSNDDRFINHSDLFQDFGHLNDKGARVFSKILSDSIQTTLAQH